VISSIEMEIGGNSLGLHQSGERIKCADRSDAKGLGLGVVKINCHRKMASGIISIKFNVAHLILFDG
jgi:hypothetical protein